MNTMWCADGEFCTTPKSYNVGKNSIIFNNDNNMISYNEKIEGVRIAGCGGGQLGTNCDGDRVALSWDKNASVYTNDIKFTNKWSDYPNTATNRSEISNDVGRYKALMIVGNKSAGKERRVQMYDRVDVYGNLLVNNRNILGELDMIKKHLKLP